MKAIKLLTLSSRSYLLVFTVLILISFGIFFFLIQAEVFRSTHEILYNRKVHIQEEFTRSRGVIPKEVLAYSDFFVGTTPLSNKPKNRYSDTIMYETVDREWDEFRKLSSSLELDGKYYKVEIIVARMETHEIAIGIARSMAIMFALMVLAFYLTSRYLTGKLWQPFYETIQQLKGFHLDQPNPIIFSPGKIKEFEELNHSIGELTDRIQRDYNNQKQFIENASHEMQTPLAITQSKLELLIEDPQLTESQSEIIHTLINSTQRLKRLNKSLILLSKIENQQFPEQETVMLEPLIRETLSNFEEQQENKNIKLEIDVEPNVKLHTNRTMVDLLVTNLIKNAFFHNQADGTIHIQATSTQFKVSNTSEAEAIPHEKLFQRFYKNSQNKESWGLGLAIVKKVSDINGWKISYAKDKEMHGFTILF